jgi:hypothetical protein
VIEEVENDEEEEEEGDDGDEDGNGEGGTAATLGRGHHFHETCIDGWVVSSARQGLDAECPF